jgi:hypothetical protein
MRFAILQTSGKPHPIPKRIFPLVLTEAEPLMPEKCSFYSTGMQFAIIYTEMKTINAQTCMAEVRLAA